MFPMYFEWFCLNLWLSNLNHGIQLIKMSEASFKVDLKWGVSFSMHTVTALKNCTVKLLLFLVLLLPLPPLLLPLVRELLEPSRGWLNSSHKESLSGRGPSVILRSLSSTCSFAKALCREIFMKTFNPAFLKKITQPAHYSSLFFSCWCMNSTIHPLSPCL